jgi:hypothetical protein
VPLFLDNYQVLYLWDTYSNWTIMSFNKKYIYRWGNNEKRKGMKNRICFVICRGSLNSCLIEFEDNGQREVVSRNALSKFR